MCEACQAIVKIDQFFRREDSVDLMYEVFGRKLLLEMEHKIIVSKKKVSKEK